MAQGTLKTRKSTAPASSTRKPSALNPKKGQRAIAPKKKNLVRQKKITKVRLFASILAFLRSPSLPLSLPSKRLLDLYCCVGERKGARC